VGGQRWKRARGAPTIWYMYVAEGVNVHILLVLVVLVVH
jgi:hypothetical protein